jgi:hypothetical protein
MPDRVLWVTKEGFMYEVTTSARFVQPDTIDESLSSIVARSVLEAALQEGDEAQLWFELASGEETARVAVDVSTSDLEEILRLSGGDDVLLALDGDAVAGLFDDPDVEGHGMKGALAIAVTSAAILAPAGQAALPQTAQPAATVQSANPAATTQVSAAATTQVASVAAAKAQLAKAQVSKGQAAKVSSLRLLRSGLLR